MLASDADDCLGPLRHHLALISFAAETLAPDWQGDMLSAACGLIAELAGVDTVEIATIRPDRSWLSLQAAHGLPPGVVGWVCLPVTPGGWTERTLAGGEVFSWEDSARDTPVPPHLAEHGISSLAAVPITGADGTPGGVLVLGSRVPLVLGSGQRSLLQASATLIARLLRRIEQDAQRRSEAEELRGSLEASQAELVAAQLRLDEEAEQRLRVEELLRQSHKMDAMGQLAAGISHDFNNLLQGICGSLELMRVRVSQGRTGDLGNFIETALASADRAALLAGQVLRFSQRRPFEPRPSRLDTLVGGMTELLRRTVGPMIRIETRHAAALWPSLCDASQIESALLDLVINARDAIGDGGTILIETGNVFVSADAAAARDLPPGEYVVLSVTDTGAGMPPEVIARGFDAFFTTKPLGQGAGLGLTMVHELVHRAGGRVWLQSQVGEGTTVTIYLPRYLGLLQVDEGEALIRPSAASVLVVDDEPGARMFVSEILTDAGYNVLEAHDSRSGLHALESEARIDLLLTDVGLPGGMNGRQLADAARRRRPGLKVLFVTGYEEADATRTGLLDEGLPVMIKPFRMEALRSAVHDLVGR